MMSKKTRIRRAEQAVIAAAALFIERRRAFLEARLQGEDGREAMYAEADAVFDLEAALKDLDQAGMELPDAAPVGVRHPLTSDQAAAFIRGKKAQTMASRIVAQLRWAVDGATVEELCRFLNGKHQSISARVNELRNDGWIHPVRHRETSGGRAAEVYKLTPRADQLLLEEAL